MLKLMLTAHSSALATVNEHCKRRTTCLLKQGYLSLS